MAQNHRLDALPGRRSLIKLAFALGNASRDHVCGFFVCVDAYSCVCLRLQLLPPLPAPASTVHAFATPPPPPAVRGPCLLYLATAAAGLFHKLGDLAGINIFGCMDGKLEGIGDGSRTAV